MNPAIFAAVPRRKYDYSLIRKADALTRGRNDGTISLADMKVLWEHAQQSGIPQEVAQETFDFLLVYRTVDDDAEKWYQEQQWEPTDLNARIEAILRNRFGLPYLRWDIPAEEVARQEALENQQGFEEALTLAMHALLYQSEPLYPRAIEYAEIPWLDPIGRINKIQGYLSLPDGEATLELLPLDFSGHVPVDERDNLSPEDIVHPEAFWTFRILATRDFNFDFYAQVRRKGDTQVFAYAASEFHPNTQQDLLRLLLETEYDLTGIRWQIDPIEVTRQRRLGGKVSFMEALRAAMDSFLQEDEGGLRSIIAIRAESLKQDAFSSPAGYEWYLDELVRITLQKSLLQLIPLDQSVLSSELPWPESDESVEENWIFHLRIPSWGDYDFWAVVDRSGERDTYNYHFN